jgi:hypothetical protein
LQGYATDDAFDTEAAEIAEVMMGVDGILSAGYVPAPFTMTIHFQADSPSIAIFDSWDINQASIKEVLPAAADIALPSISKTFVLSNGFLRSVKRMPDARKVLQPVQYSIVWGNRTVLPIA